MRYVGPAIIAAAFLSIATPVEAQITKTDYSATSTGGSGTFSLNFDTSTSTYSLDSLDFTIAANYNSSNSGLQDLGTFLAIGGNAGGVSTASAGVDDILIIFDPTLASQTAYHFDYALGTAASLLSDNLTITQTGTIGTITTYSAISSAGSGTFSVDHDLGTYSLTALDFTIPITFDTSNAGVQPVNNGFLVIGGTPNGVDTIDAGISDISIIFDPTLASQTAYHYDWASGTSPLSIQSADLTITQVLPAVPEPSTWALMLLGFGALGSAMRLRRAADQRSGVKSS